MTLITISFFVIVLAILAQTCNCEIPGLPSYSSEEKLNYAHAPQYAKYVGYGSVVHVPVCSPCQQSINHHQSSDHHPSIIHNCEQKEYIGHAGLQHHQQLDLGSVSNIHHAQYQDSVPNVQHQHLAHQHVVSNIHHQNHQHLGSANVHQQIDHHGAEHKHTIHHHGSGVSHQVVKQQVQHNNHLSSQVHHLESEKSEELLHKKDHDAYYQFEYSVNDHKTGDVKRHKEERKGDVVNGEYSLLEDDGNVRTVKYYADWKTGFHAQVHNSKPRSVG